MYCWDCLFYIAILQYFIALVKFPIKVHCIVVHLFDFKIVFLFECDWSDTVYFFFPYSMLLWSIYGYLLFKPCFARIGDSGSWVVATTSPSINNRNNGDDTKVFWSLSLSLLCMTFFLHIYFIVFLKFNNLCN